MRTLTFTLIAFACWALSPAAVFAWQAPSTSDFSPAPPSAREDAPVDPLALPRPSLTAVRISDPIIIDGLLDEAAWSRATPTSETWIQINPNAGMPATEPTEVRVLYDDETLYMGAVLYDRNARNAVVTGLEQDFEPNQSDMFAVAIDTYLDRQNGFVFGVNPAGAVFDAQAFDDQRTVTPAWEGITEARTTVNDSSWVVELAIPFATLRFDPAREAQTWGLNFTRRMRHKKSEDAMWAPLPLQYRLYKFSMAGTLVGLRDLPRGRNLWIKPYALADRLSGADRGAAHTHADVGLDVKWGLTPRLTLDLTANTDFSQVEVDAEQVNLTRFSLFFPEKRDFFLENEGTFGFQDIAIRNYRTGSSTRSFRLFHSRRIGLSPAREPLPILAGARLSGRFGDDLEVGLIEMQTRSVEDPLGGDLHEAENFAVARVRKHLPGGSVLGAMLVNRQTTGASAGATAYNRAYGVDGNFTVLQNIVVSAYFARTDDSTPMGDDPHAAMVQAAWRSRLWNVSGLYKQVGDGFDPQVGFVDRRAVRRYFGSVGVHPRVLRSGILEINPYVDVDVYTNLQGNLETRTVTPGLGFAFTDGGSLNLELASRLERLFETTPIAGADIASGEYDWMEPTIRYVAPGNRALSGQLSLSWGEFYDGRRSSVTGTMQFRPSAHIRLEASAQHNELELGGSSFTADLVSAQIRYAKDTRMFFMGFLQFNEATDELITNLRFNLIHAPLSDVFLVYTERRALAPGIVDHVLDRGLTLKVTKLLAF